MTREQLYSGKAKTIYKTDDPETLIAEFRNSLTAFNGEKKGEMEKKGYYNAQISKKLFEMLELEGTKTHYIEMLRKLALGINELLVPYLDERGIILPDFKLEFGRVDGEIILADEISCDTCRFWDKKTGQSMDKDVFRFDKGDISKAYEEVARRIVPEIFE